MPDTPTERPSKKGRTQTRDTTTTPVRNTHVRGKIPAHVRHALWGKNAGRCTLCNHRLFGETKTFWHSINAAEMAHIVGATDTTGSPRGSTGRDPDLDRESEENLLLCCHECHKMIDDADHARLWTVEKLRELKAQHENFVEMATADGGLTRTAVIRVGADIRGSYSIASRQEVAETLFANNQLGLVESQRTGHFRCDIAGETTDPGYWAMAAANVNRTLRNVHQAITDDEIAHISVFALAPIPVLVLLGARLDDKVETQLWQKHRDAGWTWPTVETTDVVGFDHAADRADERAVERRQNSLVAQAPAEDVVLVASLSAEVDASRLPEHLQLAPRLTLRPRGVEPHPNVLRHAQSLANYAAAFREMLAAAERAYPAARRWHLIGAVPVSAAIESGRAFMRDAQPPVLVYQRTADGFYPAVLTVNEPMSAPNEPMSAPAAPHMARYPIPSADQRIHTTAGG